MKGFFVSLEGGDGAGKTTLARSLRQKLEGAGYDPVLTRAPGGTELGVKIRTLLLEEASMDSMAEMFLFMADRAEHTARVILPALEAGKIILCDRFHDSTLAYQGAARGIEMSKVQELCSLASRGIRPDLTLYLDIDPRVGLARSKGKQGSHDRIEAEELSFHIRLREAYLTLVAGEPERFSVLDGGLSPEMLTEKAWEIVCERFLLAR